PVVLVNVVAGAPGRTERARPAGQRAADWAELLPELGDGIHVTKRTWGAFHGTGLHDTLQRAGVTQVVLAGIATSKGVESTARAAHEHGYHVVVASDAVADTDPDAHHNSLTRIFPALGETGDTAEILALLAAAKA
ncbi:MAG: isochorismatase family protein, partial [Microbacterium sp.]|uniref:isochorismatase family protein n=1 Tax=Microbacterium sp. TaxID=51671 RepID=UPI0039E21D10